MGTYNHSYDVDVAKKLGVAESVLLNNFYYWIRHNKSREINYHDGCYWTYNTVKSLNLDFPEFTAKQIRYALDKLVKKGIIIKANYNDTGYDRTLWYSITRIGYEILGEADIDSFISDTVDEIEPEEDQKQELLISENDDHIDENIELSQNLESSESGENARKFAICQNGQMHLTKMANGCAEIGKAIPNINTDNNNTYIQQQDIDIPKETNVVVASANNQDQLIEKIMGIFDGKITRLSAMSILSESQDIDLIKHYFEMASQAKAKNVVGYIIAAIRGNYDQNIISQEKITEQADGDNRSNNSFANFEQRSYSSSEIESMLRKKLSRQMELSEVKDTVTITGKKKLDDSDELLNPKNWQQVSLI